MMMFAALLQSVPGNSSQSSTLIPAINWAMGLIFGPLATSIAVIAVAWVGFAMLSGRMEIRRALTVMLGCFVLFGAKGIAEGLRGVATAPNSATLTNAPPPPAYPKAPSTPNNGNAYDPYAGAAVKPVR